VRATSCMAGNSFYRWERQGVWRGWRGVAWVGTRGGEAQGGLTETIAHYSFDRMRFLIKWVRMQLNVATLRHVLLASAACLSHGICGAQVEHGCTPVLVCMRHRRAGAADWSLRVRGRGYYCDAEPEKSRGWRGRSHSPAQTQRARVAPLSDPAAAARRKPSATSEIPSHLEPPDRALCFRL